MLVVVLMLHIVHYDSESYDSLSEAAQRPQGLAVLGILIEVGETKNPAYEHILSHLHEIRHKDQKTSVPPFNVRELLPPLLAQFFRYNGSLTTPPCYQSVLWTVFSRRAQISMGQLEKLQETLFSTEEEPSKLLVQNYRAPQPLNQRAVFASFIQVGSLYTTVLEGEIHFWKTLNTEFLTRLTTSPDFCPSAKAKLGGDQRLPG
ncbi:hypothetical protein CB1_000914013 [Camelus ferus]|nr:hypothetical protein CB1_000914013 [Camelus ferus]